MTVFISGGNSFFFFLRNKHTHTKKREKGNSYLIRGEVSKRLYFE